MMRRGDRSRLAQRGGRQHDAEFVAAGCAPNRSPGRKPRLRHEGKVAAGTHRPAGMTVGVVDGLEVVEIDHEQTQNGLARAIRSGAFPRSNVCSNCRRLPTPVRSSISARSATLVAQTVHRHQEEAEVANHGKENQRPGS